jgi:hypothetical protein
MAKTLSYYIHVEEMRPFGENRFAAKPIVSEQSNLGAAEPPPVGELWAPSESEAILRVRSAMQDWASRNGYTLSEA